MKKTLLSGRTLTIPVIKGVVLGVTVYRGYARLSDLAAVSRADIYDQKNNPTGTQRDLSPKHARKAYEYVKERDFAFWPEVFLCARSDKVARFRPNGPDDPFGRLEIDIETASSKRKIAISRVDGNHRLHYAEGVEPDYPPIHKTVSFCMAYDLTREQEIVLFKDINDNQKAMNTSHLDNIEIRLSPEEEIKHKNPDLYIAQKLGRDEKSPLHDKIYEGGRKRPGASIPLRSLRTGVKYMLARASQLSMVQDVEVQYKLVRNFFAAVRKWQPRAWDAPREYIILRGAGLWAACFIGAHVIDKMLLQEDFTVDGMLKILRSGREWDWGNLGDFKGYSGRAGALEISKKVTNQFYDRGKRTSKELFKKILASD